MLATGAGKALDPAECSTWVLSVLSPWQTGWRWMSQRDGNGFWQVGGYSLPRGNARGRWMSVGVTVSCRIGKNYLVIC